ncbi:hypothetical protein BDV96DRAFT_332355 [Lophiotrema nucula]|uniref:Uncharacterized protein n=1 Tax=Lophiotrema nucula TaxID=690887 RepID=A0A6A5YJW7_9PLEO|nr:hypothetical protein BDV96DRAFT_332355 [Lophiotrema nucula]
MASTTVALPENFQLQSPLVRLPAEIKHIIYGFCFTAEGPIIDPIGRASRPRDGPAPNVAIGLLQTCRRIYHEADRRPLFSQNIFRFTCVDHVRCFFRSLGVEHRSLIQDIEVDAKRVHSDHPGVGRDWLHYLAWGGGTWAKILGSLREDAPGLKSLRLNFESWPYIPMFRAELWNLLRSLLLHVRGLERIVVVGASKGAGMAAREPWSPVHYVGGDDVGSDDLVQRMWRVVGQQDDKARKVIRWTRRNGKMHLEVVTTAYLCAKVERTWSGPSSRKSYTDPWPTNGSCTWAAYENRNSDTTSEPTTKGLNPSAAG